jgi:hypothetical protein
MRDGRLSIGSVTGSLDSISLRRRPHAGLWTTRGARRVRVELPDDELVAAARVALGALVVVRGVLRRDDAGRVLSVWASHVEVLSPLDEAAPLTDMVGAIPGMTGGLDPVAYVEAVRGG